MNAVSFEAFYRQYYLRIFNYINKKINSRSDAEDLTSEVFVYCYEHFNSYDPEKSSLSTWAFLVAGCRLKNYYRDKRNNTDISELENFLYEECDDLGRAVYLEQLRSHMASALKKLPEKQRRLVIMRYFEEKSFDYIAEELDISPGNARVILSRALDALEKLCIEFEP